MFPSIVYPEEAKEVEEILRTTLYSWESLICWLVGLEQRHLQQML